MTETQTLPTLDLLILDADRAGSPGALRFTLADGRRVIGVVDGSDAGSPWVRVWPLAGDGEPEDVPTFVNLSHVAMIQWESHA